MSYCFKERLLFVLHKFRNGLALPMTTTVGNQELLPLNVFTCSMIASAALLRHWSKEGA